MAKYFLLCSEASTQTGAYVFTPSISYFESSFNLQSPPWQFAASAPTPQSCLSSVYWSSDTFPCWPQPPEDRFHLTNIATLLDTPRVVDIRRTPSTCGAPDYFHSKFRINSVLTAQIKRRPFQQKSSLNRAWYFWSRQYWCSCIRCSWEIYLRCPACLEDFQISSCFRERMSVSQQLDCYEEE